jgi:hypothetical protein
LTITGTGFGCDKGQVIFTNSAQDISPTMHTQTPDIQTWQDNQITVWVPSCQVSGDGMAAGSGSVQIQTAPSAGSVISSPSSDVLNIPWAALNVRDGSNNPVYVGLENENGSGGYTFTPDNTTVSSTALGTITQAMNDWKCETGVNFQIGTGGNNLNESPTDGVNAIFFGTPNIGALVTTKTSVSRNSACNYNGAIVDIDMIISNTATWDYTNTTTPASGDITLLGTIRHEFGHASGLREVINTSDLMNWEDLGTGTSALPISGQDRTGGLYVLTDVPNQISSCFSTNIQSYPTGCGVSGINTIDSQFNVSVSPNPFNENIVIHADIEEANKMKVSIFDIIGQTIETINYGSNYGIINKELNLSNLSSGIYVIQISIGDHTSEFKLVKK